MSKESKLVRNTGILAIGNLCTKCISFLLMPLYTALLTTQEYGTVDLIVAISSLFTIILTLQLDQGVFRFLVEARGDSEQQEKYIGTTIFTVLFTSCATAIFGTGVLNALDYTYTFYLVCNTILGIITTVFLQFPRGMGDNAVYVTGSCISGSANVVLNVVFVAFLRWGIKGMLLANLLGSICCVLFIAIKTKLWNYLKISNYSKMHLAKLLRYSMPLVPYTMCWWIVNVSDRMIINSYLGVSFNGIYALSNKFPSLFSMLSGIFQTAWMESAFENVNDDNRNVYYCKMMNTAIRFYSSANMLIIAAVPLVFGFLVGVNFREAYMYIPLLMTASMFHAVSALFGAVYFAFKKTGRVAFSAGLAALINIVVNILFIESIGLYAAALSTLLAYGTVCMLRYYRIQREVGLKLGIKYVVAELAMYIANFVSYYSNNLFLQMLFLVLAVAYCYTINKDIILSMLTSIEKRLMNRRGREDE